MRPHSPAPSVFPRFVDRAIGALLREGQLVQFHLRDKQTSADDLEQVLGTYLSRASHDQVAGALLIDFVLSFQQGLLR